MKDEEDPGDQVTADVRQKKKLLGKLPKEKKKIHLNLEKIVSGISWVFKIAVTCLIAFVAVWYWGQQVSTVGDSMRPVLKNADKVLVNRIVYNASSPKRGDIIVFKPKGNESSHYYTKRIVGLPGETVQIVENRIISMERNWKKIYNHED